MIMTKQRIRTLACLAFLAFAFSVGLPAVADAAEKVPAGFIAVSKDWLTFDDAKAFCEQQGGKLPRINNSDSVDAGGKLAADGFGAPGDPWPAGLSNDAHWTDTTDSAGKRWLAMENGGNVFLSDTKLAAPVPYRVACVKK